MKFQIAMYLPLLTVIAIQTMMKMLITFGRNFVSLALSQGVTIGPKVCLALMKRLSWDGDKTGLMDCIIYVNCAVENFVTIVAGSGVDIYTI